MVDVGQGRDSKQRTLDDVFYDLHQLKQETPEETRTTEGTKMITYYTGGSPANIQGEGIYSPMQTINVPASQYEKKVEELKGKGYKIVPITKTGDFLQNWREHI